MGTILENLHFKKETPIEEVRARLEPYIGQRVVIMGFHDSGGSQTVGECFLERDGEGNYNLVRYSLDGSRMGVMYMKRDLGLSRMCGMTSEGEPVPQHRDKHKTVHVVR